MLELILVMMVLAIVMGGGLGLFSSLDVGKRQAAGLVKNVLRTAQNSAIARQAPARVRIDAAAGTLRAEAMGVIGTWHFEGQRIRGAFGLDGAAEGGFFIEDGYLGEALAFDGSGPASARIEVQYDPAFDLRDGFAIECALRKEALGAGWLLRVGSACALRVNDAGVLEGRFTSRLVKDERAQPGGDVIVRSQPGVIPADRWVRIKLEYDRNQLVLSVDGVPVAAVEESAPVWAVDGPLLISDPRRSFSGAIDALVISALQADELAELPDSVRLAPETPSEVIFDGGGGLDRRRHADPVLIRLDYEDGSHESIVVGIYGTVE